MIILDSTTVDLNPIQTDTIDNTQVYFKNGNDTLFLISFRRAESQIVFNSHLGGKWGAEQRVDLAGKLKNPYAAIMVHDQGEGFEVSIDFVHAAWYHKRDARPVKRLQYMANKNQKPVLADVLKVSVYPSMQKVFSR